MEAVRTSTNTNTVAQAAIHSGNDSKKESSGSLFIQPKLTIGSPDDPLEKEADDMADKVMRMEMPGQINFFSAKNTVNRKCAHCEEEEKQLQRKERHRDSFSIAPSGFYQPKIKMEHSDGFYEEENIGDKAMRVHTMRPNFSFGKNCIHRKCAHCEEEKGLQRKEINGNSASFAPPVVHDVINSSGGKSLDSVTRSFMESRFSYDFSNVKIHDGDLAAKSASSINALAYTSGNNIVFNSGEYNTNSDSGKRLLAHELTHVVQQGACYPTKDATVSDNLVKSHSPHQILKQNDPGSSASSSPTSVELVRVSCESNTIEFYTDQGVFIYELTDCAIGDIDLDYMSDVTVDGNNVNFSGPPDHPEVAVRFAYRIRAGQPNPSTFFPSQRTVHIVTGTLSPPPGPGTTTGTGHTGPGPGGPLVCARPLDIPVLGRFANHAFVNDPILGNNYAIREPMVSGNGLRGCTNKTSASDKPDIVATSTCKTCNPLPGQSFSDVSNCLKAAYDAYASPNLYMNMFDPADGYNWGPNSNTFAATLAKCCADSSDAGLERVPGWNHSPAIPCPDIISISPPGEDAGPTAEDIPDAGVPAGVPAAPCIQPINWTHGNARDFGPDAIRVDISWDSSSGVLADLKDCTVREVVNYGPIPDPPFGWRPPNPTILTVAGVDGAATDTHSYPPGLASIRKVAGTMVANQVYEWRCTSAECDGAWHGFPSQNYTISREVFGSGSTWSYRITKAGGVGFNYSRTEALP